MTKRRRAHRKFEVTRFSQEPSFSAPEGAIRAATTGARAARAKKDSTRLRGSVIERAALLDDATLRLGFSGGRRLEVSVVDGRVDWRAGEDDGSPPGAPIDPQDAIRIAWPRGAPTLWRRGRLLDRLEGSRLLGLSSTPTWLFLYTERDEVEEILLFMALFGDDGEALLSFEVTD